MDFGEARAPTRTASGPRVIPGFRNLAIAIFRLARHASIAAALTTTPAGRFALRTIMNCWTT
jgi:hypothetical protein